MSNLEAGAIFVERPRLGECLNSSPLPAAIPIWLRAFDLPDPNPLNSTHHRPNVRPAADRRRSFTFGGASGAGRIARPACFRITLGRSRGGAMSVRQEIALLVDEAARAAQAEGEIPPVAFPEAMIERPARPEH